MPDITLVEYWNEINKSKKLVFKLQNGFESIINLEIGGKKLNEIIIFLSKLEINYELNCDEDERNEITKAVENTAYNNG